MSLQDTLKRIVQEQGKDVLQKPELLSVMEDYQAFAKEGPATKAVMQQLVKSGGVQALLATRKSGTGLHPEIKRLISDTADLGFKEEIVSDILKAIVFASGKMSRENEWPKVLTPQKTPNILPSKETPKKPSVWNRVRKWLKLNFSKMLVIPFLITAMCTVVTLSLTCFAFFFDPAEVSYWAKEFLICLISSIVIFFTFCFTDR